MHVSLQTLLAISTTIPSLLGFSFYLTFVPTVYFSIHLSLEGGGKGFGSKSHIFDWPDGTRLWRKYAKLRMQLFPYIYTQAHTAHQVCGYLYVLHL